MKSLELKKSINSLLRKNGIAVRVKVDSSNPGLYIFFLSERISDDVKKIIETQFPSAEVSFNDQITIAHYN